VKRRAQERTGSPRSRGLAHWAGFRRPAGGRVLARPGASAGRAADAATRAMVIDSMLW